MKKYAAFVLISLALTSCTYLKKQTVIGDQERAYRQAQAEPPLKVPTDLSHSQIGSDTETLPTNVQAESLKEIPLPPGSLADQVATGKVSKKVLDVKLPEPK